jgi:hypothetical protein
MYLRDDARSARQILRHAAQDASSRQLQRLAQYWAAKLSSVFGEYDHARTLFEQAKEDAAEDTVERWELQRVLLENEFFGLAGGLEASAKPRERLARALHTLKQLELVADALETKAGEGEHATHEVAATRADIYAWIAYRQKQLFKPLPIAAQERAGKPAISPPGGEIASLNDDGYLQKVQTLGDDTLRAWATEQARRIYAHQRRLQPTTGIDFVLAFGQAECHFALNDPHDLGEYRDIEQKARDGQVGAHREYRWSIGLRQIDLICKARLLYHSQTDTDSRFSPGDEAHLKAEVQNVYARLLEALDNAPDHELRYFSYMQRRNLSEEELREEAKALRNQALPLEGGTSAGRP